MVASYINLLPVQTGVIVHLYFLRRHLVQREYGPDSPALCWIDVIFSNLDSFIHALLSNDVPNLGCLPETLQISKRRQQLLVASQLPCTSPSFKYPVSLINWILDADDWLSLPNVLLSGYTSPAAKRLCTTLLFVALILSPELHGDQDPWMLTQRVPLRSWREETLTYIQVAALTCIQLFSWVHKEPLTSEKRRIHWMRFLANSTSTFGYDNNTLCGE